MNSHVIATLGVLLVTVAVAGCGDSDSGDGSATVDPQLLTLRLDDLPSGYSIGDDAGCGLGTEGASSKLAEIVREYRPEGCSTPFEVGYPADERAGNPRLIQSIAIAFPSSEGAEAGVDAARDLLAWETGLPTAALKETEPVRQLGDDTRAFRTTGDAVTPAGSILFWRDASLLGAVLVGGLQGVRANGVAADYADKQQEHFESSPDKAPVGEDLALRLDDPDLRVDVYWLGRTFDPPGTLPPISLSDVFGPIGAGEGPPGDQLKIDYTRGVTLDTWTRAGWDNFRSTRFGSLVVDSPCTNSRSLKLSHGRALIYAGYASTKNGCPREPPNRYLAHVFLGDVVVAVNLPYCFMCVGRGGVYNSMAGMFAVARGLRMK